MQYEFKIKLLNLTGSKPYVFNETECALTHAQKIADEDENVPARLTVTRRGDHVQLVRLECPMHGIIDYLENFNGDNKSGLYPRSENKRYARSESD